MGAQTEIFPTFSELCAAAREVEKNPISVRPRPIEDTLAAEGGSSIFPRELEDYTYSYILFEAQKVERRISNLAISEIPQAKAAFPPRLTPEQQMAADLRRFVAAQGQENAPEPEDDVQIAFSVKKEFPKPRREEETPTPPISEGESPIPEPEEESPAGPQPKARIMPPQLRAMQPPAVPGAKKADAVAQPIPIPNQTQQAKPAPRPPHAPEARQAPSIPSARQPTIMPAPKPSPPAISANPTPHQPEAAPSLRPSRLPTEPLAVEREKVPGAAEAPAAKLPAGSSYSKLSPRLQALMEAKLRREEEKARRQKEDSEIFKQPLLPPEDEGQDGSQRFRQPSKDGEGLPEATPKPPEDADEGSEEAGGPKRVFPRHISPEGEGDAQQQEEEQPEKPQIRRMEEEREDARMAELRKMMDKALPAPAEEDAPMPEEEPPEPEPERKARAPSKAPVPKAEKEEPLLPEGETGGAIAPAEEELPLPDEETVPAQEEKEGPFKPAGPVTIRPMFPDAPKAGAQREKPELPSEESERMKRIQRIIEELSPDKARAKPGPAPKQEMESPQQEGEGREPEGGKPALAPISAKKKKGAPAGQGKSESPKKKGKAKKSREKPGVGPAGAEEGQEGGGPKPAKIPLKNPSLPKAATKRFKPPASARDAPLLKQTALLMGKEPEEPPEEEEEKQLQAPPPKKIAPRQLPQGDEDAEEPAPSRLPPRRFPPEEEAPAPRKLMPRLPPRQGQDEEGAAPRKLVPRLPPRQGQDEGQADSPAPRKPASSGDEFDRMRPAESSGQQEGENRLAVNEEPPAPIRRRILPGMARTAPSTQKTYVPPARGRQPPALPEDEMAQQEEEGGQEEVPAIGLQPMVDVPWPEQEEQAQPAASPRLAPIKPKKLVSDEPLGAEQKTPEQLAQEEKMRKMAEHLARLEASKAREVAGTAALPAEEEDIPLPEEEDDGTPRPQDYEQAKEGLRKTLQREEVARKMRAEDEAGAEQFAKEHMVWLYEIYKMGGMPREDFLQKALEKYGESKGGPSQAPAGASSEAPPNPALANLGKAIDKKDRK